MLCTISNSPNFKLSNKSHNAQLSFSDLVVVQYIIWSFRILLGELDN
jgi:hypothetical protein